MVAGISDNIQLYEEELFEFQTDPGPLQFLCVLGVVDGAQGFITFHQVE